MVGELGLAQSNIGQVRLEITNSKQSPILNQRGSEVFIQKWSTLIRCKEVITKFRNLKPRVHKIDTYEEKKRVKCFIIEVSQTGFSACLVGQNEKKISLNWPRNQQKQDSFAWLILGQPIFQWFAYLRVWPICMHVDICIHVAYLQVVCEDQEGSLNSQFQVKWTSLVS